MGNKYNKPYNIVFKGEEVGNYQGAYKVSMGIFKDTVNNIQ